MVLELVQQVVVLIQQRTVFSCQIRTPEINSKHPLIKNLLSLIKHSKDDKIILDFAHVMWKTTTLRFGHGFENSADFSNRIEQVLKQAIGVSLNETGKDEPTHDEAEPCNSVGFRRAPTMSD